MGIVCVFFILSKKPALKHTHTQIYIARIRISVFVYYGCRFLSFCHTPFFLFFFALFFEHTNTQMHETKQTNKKIKLKKKTKKKPAGVGDCCCCWTHCCFKSKHGFLQFVLSLAGVHCQGDSTGVV